MIRIGVLFHDVSVIGENLILVIGVLMMLLDEALEARESRLPRGSERLRHRLCRSHG
jgi:hypothetical protein